VISVSGGNKGPTYSGALDGQAGTFVGRSMCGDLAQGGCGCAQETETVSTFQSMTTYEVSCNPGQFVLPLTNPVTNWKRGGFFFTPVSESAACPEGSTQVSTQVECAGIASTSMVLSGKANTWDSTGDWGDKVGGCFEDSGNIHFSTRPLSFDANHGNRVCKLDMKPCLSPRPSDPHDICLPCAAGTFSSSPSSTTPVSQGVVCRECPGARFALEGSTECSMCLPGSEARTTTSPCTACLPGTFSNYTPGCNVCEGGRVANFSGAVACLACHKGTFAVDNGMDRLKHLRCELCPAGWYSDTRGSKTCKPCSVGTYNAQDDRPDACLVCPGGWFNDVAGSIACQKCDRNTFNSDRGSTALKHDSSEDCDPCPAGMISQQGALFL
jgi:hypothetical protein